MHTWKFKWVIIPWYSTSHDCDSGEYVQCIEIMGAVYQLIVKCLFLNFLNFWIAFNPSVTTESKPKDSFFNVCVHGIEHNALFFKWPFVNCSTANLSYLSKIIMGWPSYCLKENEAVNTTLCRIIYVATHFSSTQ